MDVFSARQAVRCDPPIPVYFGTLRTTYLLPGGCSARPTTVALAVLELQRDNGGRVTGIAVRVTNPFARSPSINATISMYVAAFTTSPRCCVLRRVSPPLHTPHEPSKGFIHAVFCFLCSPSPQWCPFCNVPVLRAIPCLFQGGYEGLKTASSRAGPSGNAGRKSFKLHLQRGGLYISHAEPTSGVSRAAFFCFCFLLSGGFYLLLLLVHS